MKHIVKRAGHTESYDERKLYASVYASCLAVREPVGSAELVAKEIVRLVGEWLNNKHEVSSHDIRLQASKHLKVINPDASFQYLHHKVIY